MNELKETNNHYLLQVKDISTLKENIEAEKINFFSKIESFNKGI